jgi:hypothetical protein
MNKSDLDFMLAYNRPLQEATGRRDAIGIAIEPLKKNATAIAVCHEGVTYYVMERAGWCQHQYQAAVQEFIARNAQNN